MTAVRIRNGLDRVRYAFLFEFILVALMGSSLWLLSDRPLLSTGGLAIILSGMAIVGALIYNYLLDRIDAHYGRVPTERSKLGRVLHAVGFELTLVVLGVPVIMWWMDWGFWQALMFDITAFTFIVVYTYLFTLIYDRVFPVPQELATVPAPGGPGSE
jgi:uncharacterized membrane protein